MTAVTAPISGAAMATIEGSELYSDPERYTAVTEPAYAFALEVSAALHAAPSKRYGRTGVSWQVTASPGALLVLRGYCETVGSLFAGETEPSTRSDGRALLNAVAAIDRALARASAATTTDPKEHHA